MDYPDGPVLGTRRAEVAGSLKAGFRTGSGASAPGRSPEQRGGEQKKTMISGGKVQFKREAEQKKKGGKRCLCANKGKPRLNNAMAA